MAFVIAGQIFEGESGAFPVRGSTAAVVFEDGRAITDAKGLRAFDFKVFGDLAAQSVKRKSRVSAGGGR
jgi:hypothetical protein